MLRHLFLAYIDGAESMGQVLSTGSIEVRGWFVKEGRYASWVKKQRQAQGHYGTHGLTTGELVISALTNFTVNHIP